MKGGFLNYTNDDGEAWIGEVVVESFAKLP